MGSLPGREVRRVFQEMMMSLVWDQLSLRWKQGLEVGSSRGMLNGKLK